MGAVAQSLLYVGTDQEVCRLLDTCELQVVERAQRALKLVQDRVVTAVISEVSLDDMSGLELLEEVRDEIPELPFFLLTGRRNTEIIQEAYAADVTGVFLRRPIDALSSLCEAITRTGGSKETIASLRQLNRELEDRVVEQAAALEQRAARIRRLEEEVIQTSEQERWRLGQELHDDLGQRLTAISIYCGNLVRKLEAEESPYVNRAREILRLTQEADALARDVAHGITPRELKDDPLETALQRLANEAEALYEIRCSVDTEGSGVSDETLKRHLVQIVQESIVNAVMHGDASYVQVGVRTTDDYLRLTVADNGEGFSGTSLELEESGLGVRIMKHRARVVGGALAVEPRSGGGMVVRCTVPMEG